MPLVTKANTFTNGTTADATQVNSDFDTLYNLVNGQLDTANIAPNGVQSSNLGSEAVIPAKTKGVPYAVDLFGSTGFVLSGLTVTKDGTNANQIDIAAGVAYLVQTDGSLRRLAIGTANYKTTSASTTFYLDLNPDGTFSWGGSHSSQSNYITIATVTSDASSNVNVITDTRQTLINLLSGIAGVVNLPGNSKSNGNILTQILSGGYKFQSGSFNATTTTSNSPLLCSQVNFPTAFSSAPIVVCMVANEGSSATLANVWLASLPGTGGFVPYVQTAVAQQVTVHWVAIGS